ncbi:MAG: 5-carboxymethyl-2-hydroxymuconate isomerase [Gammaproteobacteria bacterium]
MPHIRIEYSPNVGEGAQVDALCQTMLATLIAMKNDQGIPVFPAAGTRVLAYKADYAAVGPGDMGRGFVYVNVRVAPGRNRELLEEIGHRVQGAVTLHFQRNAPDLPCRVTIHVDEGRPMFEAKGEIGTVQ